MAVGERVRGILSPRDILNLCIARTTENDGIRNAFRAVDRAKFLDKIHKNDAYRDEAIQLCKGSSVSQPSLIAEMIDALSPKRDGSVLEIGTATGYQAAILSFLTAHVYTVEYNPKLADTARQGLNQLGFTNIDVHIADGALGLPQNAPFDAIIVSAACLDIPDALVDQLAQGGSMVLPVGKDPSVQRLEKIVKAKGGITREIIEPNVHFHHLISPAHGGWTKDVLKSARQEKENFILFLKKYDPMHFLELTRRAAKISGKPEVFVSLKEVAAMVHLPDSFFEELST